MSENVEIFNSKKKFSKDMKLNVFKLIEQGSTQQKVNYLTILTN